MVGLVCLAILAATTAYLMGWWIPQDTIRNLQSRGFLEQDTTDVATDSALVFLDRPFSEPDPPARQLPEGQAPPASDVTAGDVPVTEPIERTPPSSMARVELGVFPIYHLVRGEYQETTALNRVAVSVEIPSAWSASDGQMFDARGNKIGEIGPGVVAYLDGAACASLPDSEMDGPPVEEYGFAMVNASGVYRRTESFCSGNGETYSGQCHVHSYCVQPPPDGMGFELTFLELSASTEQKTRYDRVVNSVRLAP